MESGMRGTESAILRIRPLRHPRESSPGDNLFRKRSRGNIRQFGQKDSHGERMRLRAPSREMQLNCSGVTVKAEAFRRRSR